MKKNLFFCFILASILRGYAQEKTILSKNFKFHDGVYRQYSDFQKNLPNIKWDSVETSLATNPKSLITYIEFLKFKKTQIAVNLDSVWGVVIDGIPYVKLANTSNKRSSVVFAGMVLRGKLCYFQFDEVEEKNVPMTAYIPETGQPYVTKNVLQKRDVIREKLILFDTGEIRDFTLPNFRQLINDDKELLATVNALKPREVPEKLFKCLLIFNDRNPVFLKN